MNDDDLEITAGCHVAHPNQRGGQHVAKKCTDVLVVHKPTGIAVRCGDERSQFKCREKAVARLRAIIALLPEHPMCDPGTGEGYCSGYHPGSCGGIDCPDLWPPYRPE